MSLPAAAVTIVEGPTGQKREASKKRLPLFRRDKLKHGTANAQARERCNNAGRVTVSLSEANRALYPTRVHYFVMPNRLTLPANQSEWYRLRAVSYTHLTLPTKA